MNRILIVEDERPIADIIAFHLKREGYETEIASTGTMGLEMGLDQKWDLILLDIMLPGMDGFQVLRKLREKITTPVLMLTAKEEEVDKILGLELGADDYITKPFSNRELVARIKSNLRRVNVLDKADDSRKNRIVIEDLTVDFDQYQVYKKDQNVELTLREFELLKYLIQNKGQILSREALLKEVWDYEYYGDIRTVDVTVRRLREKIEEEPANPRFIMTKRGVGYYFNY